MEDRAHIFYTGDKDQTRWQLTAILENLTVEQRTGRRIEKPPRELARTSERGQANDGQRASGWMVLQTRRRGPALLPRDGAADHW